jgi:hydrogenase expression/formation protein HypD
MKHIDEYRDSKLVKAVLAQIHQLEIPACNLMEVCGTHTMAIARSGIRQVLPPQVKLLSGPGCPVCVTPQNDIDYIVALAQQAGVIIASYGDMLRVPGTSSSLEQARGQGARIEVVYSSDDALQLAVDNKDAQIVFVAVGFETTAPGIAATILETARRKLGNLSFFVTHKLVPPALQALTRMPRLKIDGLICPGHASAIIGCEVYEALAGAGGLPCVVVGFEPLDVAEGLYMLLKQISERRAEVENQYSRLVKQRGNPRALEVMYRAYEVSDAEWRGLGVIPGSGLKLRKHLRQLDARQRFRLKVAKSKEPSGCRCGDVLCGLISPKKCKLFGKACKPETPVGPCMVSSEGSCAAYYRYL